MNRSAIKMSAVSAAAALTLAACGGGGDDGGTTAEGGDSDFNPDEPVSLSLVLWGNDDRANRYEEAIDLFNEEYPNIEVQSSWAAWPDYWPARATEAAGSSLPDVIQMDLSYLRQFGGRNQLLDLSPYLGEQIDTSTFEETDLASGQIDGATYAIPTGTNTLALYSNPDVVEATGVEVPGDDYTWQDYNEYLRATSEAGADMDPQLYGGPDYTGVFWIFALYMLQQGNEVFDEEGVAFTEDDMREFLNLTADLREENLLYPADRTVQLAPLTGFTSNEAATEFNWDNMLGAALSDSGAEELVLHPTPSNEDGEKGLFRKPAMFMSAGANTENPEAAALFIDFMVNNPDVGEVFGTTRGLPASSEQREGVVLEGIDAQVAEYEEAVTDYVTASVPQPVEGFGALEATYLRLSEELGLGTITVDEFVDQWFAEAEQTLGS